MSSTISSPLPQKKERSRFTKMCVDIVAGTIAGINVTLVGHPFDTLKVRLQTQPHDKPIYNGLVDCFKKTVKWEGPTGLYKGVQSPLVGQMFFRANMFFAFGEAKRFFSNNGQKKIKTIEYYYAGAMAWGWGALVECPIDVFKTQMQIQIIKAKSNPELKPEFNGIVDCFKKVMKANGILGAYQGFLPHVLRNIPGGALHLGTFEYLRNKFAEERNIPVTQLPMSLVMLAGSIGGVLFWITTFPLDVVKSAIQGDSPFKEKKRFNGISDAISQLYKEGGYKRFFKGLSPCMLRSVPANAVLLLTSSYLSEHL
jgi:solute carrier family 25 (mitochondrial carnitine/acylcarnitine transporter), member 20/29